MPIDNSKPAKCTAPPVYRPSAPPVAVQPKAISGAVSRVAAPPVYRPSAPPVAVQPKAMSGAVSRVAAPPVYRPSAPPVTMQPKAMSGPVSGVAAPPVYRPSALPVTVQPKLASDPVSRVGAPPVYRSGAVVKPQDATSPVSPIAGVPGPFRSASGSTTVQRLKIHAEAYAKRNKIEIGAITKESVETYVNDRSNPSILRRGLLQAWNARGTNRTRRPQPSPIASPEDLRPKPVVAITEKQNSLVDWDSDDDDDTDLNSLLTSNTLRKATIFRPSTGRSIQVPVVPLSVAIRYGRQAVKRRKLSECFSESIIVPINAFSIEFAAPRGNDVVAFRLKPDEDGDLLRQGGVGAWNEIASNLDRELAELDKDLKKSAALRSRKRKRITDPFEGCFAVETETEAEAVGAIACDFIKGSGNWEYVDAIKNAPEDSKPTDLFSGNNRIYGPAGPLGRQLATQATERKKVKLKKRPIPTPVPALIDGRAVHDVAGDGMDCLIRAILYSALGNIDEAHVTIIRDHLVRQGVAAHGQMLDLARAAGSILITFLIYQGILGATQGIKVYVPDGNGGIAPPIVVSDGPNKIRLWLSNEHFRSIR